MRQEADLQSKQTVAAEKASLRYITSKNRDSSLPLAVEQALIMCLSSAPLLERLLVVDLGGNIYEANFEIAQPH